MRAISIGLVAVVVLITAVAAFAQTPGNSPVVDVHENGAFGGVYEFVPTDSGFLNLYFQVSRTGGSTPGSTVTNLFYFYQAYIFSPNPPYTTYVSTLGYGQIPNMALQGDSTAHLSLTVDTSQIAGFTVTTCTQVVSPFSYTCAPGPLGPVHFDWQQLNSFQQHVAGTTDTNWGDYSTFEQDNIDQAEASATGNIVQLQVSNASATIGINHNGEVVVYHNPPQQ